MHCQTWRGIPWHTSTTSAKVMETEGRRRSAAPHVVKLLSWREWRAILFGFPYSSSFSIENVECSYQSGRTRSIICSQHISEEFSRQLSDLVNSFYSQRQSAASRTKSIMQRNTLLEQRWPPDRSFQTDQPSCHCFSWLLWKQWWFTVFFCQSHERQDTEDGHHRWAATRTWKFNF